jgi:hypothetical protein
MTDQWYFSRSGTPFGPFSVARLKELAAAGQIQRGDTVWKEGMLAGVLAAKVKHLFATPAAAAVTPDAPALVGPPPADPPAAEAPPAPRGSPPALTALGARLANPADLELAPGEAAPWAPAASQDETQPAKANPPPAPSKPRERRVLSVKGGILASQNGQAVKFRKRCLRCGYADTSMTTMPIRPGVTRVNFYCPKCKKSQQTEVQGVG